MVLQKSPAKANIWGYGNAGADVSVTIDGKTVSHVTIGSNTQWNVLLPPMGAGGPHVLTFTSGGVNVTLNDVMFGDVWVCSGQSNMYFQVKQLINHTDVMNRAHAYSSLRIFKLDRVQSATPLTEPTILNQWHRPGNDATTSSFSAVCLLYAMELIPDLGIPMGMVESSWGGTPVETWSSPDAINVCNAHRGKRGPGTPSVLWNAMIHPILPMTIAGAIWYQGENNAGHAAQYSCQFSSMIQDWREKFHQQSGQQTSQLFHFGFVQLAPNANKTIHAGFTDLRWAQTASYGYVPNPTLRNVFMAVAMDLPDFHSPYGTIHPRDKYDVAERLALAARVVAYNESNIEYQGPFPSKFTLSGHTMTIEYDQGNNPIEVRSDRGFEVCCGHSNNFTCGIYNFRPAPITQHDQSTVTIDTSVCHGTNHFVTGVRYAWEVSPCDVKMCAIYGEDDDLPAPAFIKHVPF
ncbi:sialate O-acetylesterase-like [Mya arenaria]|uniref:sialate O-acetylesterase-like n=1 Tax=Mya arenaria TaxID=6604 RepID=UPI0022E81719|nr:sialate O-acetylesterase-like [Mya arenaria]